MNKCTAKLGCTWIKLGLSLHYKTAKRSRCFDWCIFNLPWIIFMKKYHSFSPAIVNYGSRNRPNFHQLVQAVQYNNRLCKANRNGTPMNDPLNLCEIYVLHSLTSWYFVEENSWMKRIVDMLKIHTRYYYRSGKPG